MTIPFRWKKVAAFLTWLSASFASPLRVCMPIQKTVCTLNAWPFFIAARTCARRILACITAIRYCISALSPNICQGLSTFATWRVLTFSTTPLRLVVGLADVCKCRIRQHSTASLAFRKSAHVFLLSTIVAPPLRQRINTILRRLGPSLLATFPFTRWPLA